MRIDDIAYQRATRVAGFGFFVQLLIGLTLLIFGIVVPDQTGANGDTAIRIASVWALVGIVPWLGLVVVFNQHRLERIEALESDELRQQRLAGVGSAFETEDDRFNVAGRRLRLMHKWLMPILSWLIIILLIGFGWVFLDFISRVTSPDFAQTDKFAFRIVSDEARGWALAICLGLAAVSFILSRFVSGMSKQPAWQNLRGGAGWMVGNALVLLAVAAGIIFTYFDNYSVMEVIARATCWFMFVMSAEIFLNFLLNLYRPRRPGEVPRPAFDSRMLSMLSAPDSIVRSINEAVNYQFGFDITSSWGYQLLIRATRRLAVFAIIILVALNCFVIVEPHQQAVRLRGGAIVGEPHGPGIMFKLPWPFERAETYDVTRAQLMPLTAVLRTRNRNDPITWTGELDQTAGIEPFIVAARSAVAPARRSPAVEPPTEETAPDEQDVALESLDENFALIETEIYLHYRIKADPREGLLKYIRFANDERQRRQQLNQRARSLKAIALREVTQYLTGRNLDDVVASDRAQMALDLEMRIQKAFDDHETGVQVLTVSNSWVRPAGEAAPKFESVGFEFADREQARVDATREFTRQLVVAAGETARGEAIVREADRLKSMREEGASEEEIEAQMQRIDDLLFSAGGEAAKRIAEARTAQWTKILGAEARAAQFKGQLEAYHAGPALYREFLLMDVLTRILQNANKYIIAVDPRHVTIDVELLQDDESMVFEEALAPGETVEKGVGQQ